MEKVAAATVQFSFTPEFISARPDIVGSTKERMAKSSGPGYAMTARNIFVPHLDVHFDSVKEKLLCLQSVPVLILAGEKDILTPVSTQRALHDAIPGSRLEIISGAGHMAPIEKADTWNSLVSGFLEDIE